MLAVGVNQMTKLIKIMNEILNYFSQWYLATVIFTQKYILRIT